MNDEHLIAEIDVLKSELAIISQKLESKSQAVLILHELFERCKTERDQFQHMAEQVMNRYQLLRKAISHGVQVDNLSLDEFNQLNNKNNQLTRKQLVSLLLESNEANKGLEQELNKLRAKLCEAHGDIKLLRKQLKTQPFEHCTFNNQKQTTTEKQQMVFYMEKLVTQITDLQQELSRCMDEKQELTTERDIYRNKCDRLNNELNYILNGDERKIVDIDALITEKKSLTHRLQAVEEEKKLAMTTLSKYLRIVERKVSKTSSISSDCQYTPSESPKHQVISTSNGDETEEFNGSKDDKEQSKSGTQRLPVAQVES